MQFEVVTKTIVTKWYVVEAENEKEAVDKAVEPLRVEEDHEELAWVEEIKKPEAACVSYDAWGKPSACKFCGDKNYNGNDLRRNFGCSTKYWYKDKNWVQHNICKKTQQN